MTRRSGKVEKHLKSKEHGILLQSPQSGGERDSLPAGIPDWTPAENPRYVMRSLAALGGGYGFKPQSWCRLSVGALLITPSRRWRDI